VQRRLWLLAAAALSCGAGLSAGGEATSDTPLAVAGSLPPYRAEQRVTGTLRLWGHGSPKHDFMGALVSHWMRDFQRQQPAVQLENRLYGTASAIGALYTGSGNLAILGEEISPAAAAAFNREKGYPPTCFTIATGSLDTNYFDYAHMIFVHKDNPIERLTLAQLEAIFGTEHHRGPGNLRSWGALGLGAEWAQAPIRPYGWRVDEDFALFFREAVLGGSHRWNPAIQEFVTRTRPDGSVYDRAQQILDALAHDRHGIAISNVAFANPQVKTVALAASDAGPFDRATPLTLITQRYPLTRLIPACVDRAPRRPIDPVVREFLRFILSRDGQLTLLKDSGYLPVDSKVLREQLERMR